MGKVTAREVAGNAIRVTIAAMKMIIKVRDFMVQFSFFLTQHNIKTEAGELPIIFSNGTPIQLLAEIENLEVLLKVK